MVLVFIHFFHLFVLRFFDTYAYNYQYIPVYHILGFSTQIKYAPKSKAVNCIVACSKLRMQTTGTAFCIYIKLS